MTEKLWVADDMTELDDRDRKKLYEKLAPLGVGIKIDMSLMNTEQRYTVRRHDKTLTISVSNAATARKYARACGMPVFWDVKLFGNPDAIARAVAGIAKMGVWGFTFDSCLPSKNIAAAVENAGFARPCGVTVLSSYDDDDCITQYDETRERLVCDRAWKLCRNKVSSLVCTGRELRPLAERGILKNADAVVVGIRNLGDGVNDHAPGNIVTPTYAIRNGATYLVVGRPITGAPDPTAATRGFIEEMETAAANRSEV